MNKLTVTLSGNEKIVVEQLALGKFSELLKAFDKLPAYFNEIAGLTNDQMITKLPEVIGNSLPEFLNVLSIATNIPAEKLNEMPLEDGIDLFLAVIEVNKFREIIERLKKSFNPPTKIEA